MKNLTKLALILATFACFGLVNAAQAQPATPTDQQLTTVNNTKAYSTVELLDSKGNPVLCAGSIGQYTPPQTTKGTSWTVVAKLCGLVGEKTTCTAEIYMDKDCSASDSPVADASMVISGTNEGDITITNNDPNSTGYDVTSKQYELDLNPAS